MRRSPLLVPGAHRRRLSSCFPTDRSSGLLLSSIKSRQDLFTLPPKLFFHPVWTGYEAVFGIGAASTTAIAVGLYYFPRHLDLDLRCSARFSRSRSGRSPVTQHRVSAFPDTAISCSSCLSTRMIPPVAVLVFYLVMYSRLGLIDTKVGLILVTTFINLGLATWIMKGFFDGVPTEVENIALVNGYSRLYAFRRLVLPMVRGGIAATAGFCFIFAWNEFSFASILATTTAKPLPVKISAAMGATGMEWTQIFAAGVVLVVPVAIFFYLIRRYLLIGMTFGVLGKTVRLSG